MIWSLFEPQLTGDIWIYHLLASEYQSEKAYGTSIVGMKKPFHLIMDVQGNCHKGSLVV